MREQHATEPATLQHPAADHRPQKLAILSAAPLVTIILFALVPLALLGFRLEQMGEQSAADAAAPQHLRGDERTHELVALAALLTCVLLALVALALFGLRAKDVSEQRTTDATAP